MQIVSKHLQKEKNMKKLFLLLVMLTSFAYQSYAQERPKLVVGIVVDQMRWDYLYRYYGNFRNDGLKRLMTEGFNCENTHYNYVPTVTAAGHCSVYAGSSPAFTGIAGNNFYIDGKRTYCCEDNEVQSVGSTSDAGKMSPRNSLVTSMCDQLRLATDFESKVIGVALKDRAAILPAGHSANGAYWFDKSVGGFITSTFYMNELPKWVQEFNKKNKVDPKTEVHYDPKGIVLTTDMAIAALDGEKLGNNKVTDFLAISYSSTDYVGHKYGTRGKEIDEVYRVLDEEMAKLFKALDAKVGKGNYLLFLTADHAGAHNAKFMNDHRMPGGHFSGGSKRKEVNAVLQSTYGQEKIILDVIENRLYLNRELIENARLDEEKIMKDICKELLKDNRILYAIPFKEVATANIPPAIKERIIMGYNPQRSGDIQIILRPGYHGANYEMGTTHGAWNPYDTHVPFIITGWNIKPGHTNKYATISDIAPTVCALLKIQMPTGCVGQPVL